MIDLRACSVPRHTSRTNRNGPRLLRRGDATSTNDCLLGECSSGDIWLSPERMTRQCSCSAPSAERCACATLLTAEMCGSRRVWRECLSAQESPCSVGFAHLACRRGLLGCSDGGCSHLPPQPTAPRRAHVLTAAISACSTASWCQSRPEEPEWGSYIVAFVQRTSAAHNILKCCKQVAALWCGRNIGALSSDLSSVYETVDARCVNGAYPILRAQGRRRLRPPQPWPAPVGVLQGTGHWSMTCTRSAGHHWRLALHRTRRAA